MGWCQTSRPETTVDTLNGILIDNDDFNFKGLANEASPSKSFISFQSADDRIHSCDSEFLAIQFWREESNFISKITKPLYSLANIKATWVEKLEKSFIAKNQWLTDDLVLA